MSQNWPASLVLAALWPLSAACAPPTSDLQSLRQEIESLKAGYEARLQALEQRLQAAEAAARVHAAAAAPAPTPQPAPAAAAPPTPVAAPGPSAFNPAISLILSGQVTRTRRDPRDYAIAGALLPAQAEVGPGGRGFSLAESELGLAASIDPWLQGEAHVALHPDDTVSVEEAYVRTTALGAGLTLKAGRFLSGVGYLNEQHAHRWDFVDSPLAYQALLGTQLADDGVQLRWLAPTDLFVELGVELGRGRGFPGDDGDRNGLGRAALTAHAGGDVGASHSWRAGISVLGAPAQQQLLQSFDAAGAATPWRFSGRTRLWVADAVWKWAPEGNATHASFTLQAEWLTSQRRGTLGPADAPAEAPVGQVAQSGGYLQGVAQFLPGWRLGARAERLQLCGHDRGSMRCDAGASWQPRKDSLMLDFSPSEFSRVRLQFARDRARSGLPDTQLSLQYQTSLGAHGAHGY